MKLSKQQTKSHEEAQALVRASKRRPLTQDERFFILENYHPGASHNITTSGAFFTPWELAQSLAALHGGGGRVVDLCAGIGILAFALHTRQLLWPEKERATLTCIELNQEYASVGRAVLPEAEWISGEDGITAIRRLPKFTSGLSNPPYGRVKGGGLWHLQFTLALAERCKDGAYIIMPKSDELTTMWDEVHRRETGMTLTGGCLDLKGMELDWRGTNIGVDVYDLSPC